jgi:hypothetical protein
MTLSFAIARSHVLSGMRRSKVNIKIARIFNGIFETQKSTRSGQKTAKSRAKSTWAPRVYHAGIYHDGVLQETNGAA